MDGCDGRSFFLLPPLRFIRTLIPEMLRWLLKNSLSTMRRKEGINSSVAFINILTTCSTSWLSVVGLLFIIDWARTRKSKFTLYTSSGLKNLFQFDWLRKTDCTTYAFNSIWSGTELSMNNCWTPSNYTVRIRRMFDEDHQWSSLNY